MNFLIKIFLSLFIGFSPNLFARTRDDVIREANAYKNYEWKVGPNNILDLQTHFEDKVIPPVPEPDGIDDRMFKQEEKTGIWRKSTANWPFEVNTTYTGEAYAYGGWSGKKIFGYDTTSEFELKIKGLSPFSGQKWIAGSKEEEMGTGQQGDTIVPTGYDGYAGIDCSGFKINGVLL